MITVDQICEHVLGLLHNNRDLRLEGFDKWFSGASWNMHQDSDPVAIQMASAIELALAEFDAGHITEAELRRQLSSLVNQRAVDEGGAGILPEPGQQDVAVYR